MGRVERLHWETAARLRVKKIVMGECGHAFRGAVYDGPRWLGWQFPPIPMVHAIEFYYDLLASGKIKVREKYKQHVTLQDPCNTVRGLDLGDKLRYVVDALCENFTDVSPHHEHNYCCQAGGGLINCGPPWKRSRMVSNRIKGEQLATTGAEIVITPCHNCHSGIEDIIGFYDLGMHTKFISDILMETMEIPEELKG
jgi:Fe-S oxidoreductase